MNDSNKRVKRTLWLLAFVAVGVAAACADEENDALPPSGTDGGTDTRDGGRTGSDADTTPPSPRDGGGGEDAAVDCDYTPTPPVEDGGGLCGTIGFGRPPAQFGGVDAGDTGPYRGGALPPGIYDAVIAERESGSGGSLRETLVILPGNRFTRIRQLDTGTGPGPESRRSGSYAIEDTSIRFSYDCAANDGNYIDAGSDTFPFEYVEGCGKGVYRFGLSSLRFTLERR